MKLICLILLSSFFLFEKAQAFTIFDGTSFDPKPIKVEAKNNSVPIGTILVWSKNEIPEGWLECNGQAVNQDLYPDLFALMHNTPNYQGYFLRGVGGNSDKLGVEQGDAIRNIEGDVGAAVWELGHKSSKSFYREKGHEGAGGHFYYYGGMGMTYGGKQIHFDASRVVPTANENRPVNKAVKYIIKAE